MSDSNGDGMTDINDMEDIEMIMEQLQSKQEQQQAAERVMLGSIDCMQWEWRNYPKSWHGQFVRGYKKYPTIMLEAIASYDLWIWHAFFRVAGANNDLTVLNNSLLFDDLLDDIGPVAPFECNGVAFEKGYYLADGIYPQW
ncbi:ALP1-like protein [Tanacetum coccineum]